MNALLFRTCVRAFRLVAIFGMAAASLVLHSQVRVWQGTLPLPTYEEGVPDPNPPFDQFTTNRFNYPYTLRNNLTSRRVDRAWRAIYLENEYLKCSVLPDLGGHLYTCVDKVSGKPMFYANPSIKRAAIAYRGAWAAFGIEFNFPVSHNWVTMSPVSFAYGLNLDGSASVTVGNVDRVYGMEWTVELILRPKSTLLEQRVTLSNRSDVRHRFYWWNNAGVEAWTDTQICYPMRFVATHGFTEVHPWPVDQDGIDYSILGNHKNGPVSMFAHGSRENFMGVWNPHTNTGTAHFANYDEVPAKKIWSWGVDADGLDWRKALSDNNSAYLEVQAGLFRNQETYAFLEPRQVIQFSEYWMPVREIGGISRANLAGVASLTRKGNSLVAGFNANRIIPQASIAISKGADPVFREKIDLAPERPWRHEIPTASPDASYTIEVRDSQNKLLLRQTEGAYDWTPTSEIHPGPQPSYRIPDPDQRTYDDWVQYGKEEELNGRLLSALEVYKTALTRFPNGFAAAKSAGRLAAGLLRFEEARDFLEPLQARDTTDGEISYYLGLAYEGLGAANQAQNAYEEAERLPAFRSAAALRLGELLARSGDLRSALTHVREAVRLNSADLRSQEELVAIEATLGESAQARATAQQVLARFPLSYFLREEIKKPDLAQLANDTNRILDIAAEYMRLGLYQKALRVLSRQYPPPQADQSEPGAVSPEKQPMVAYFRGYCREKLGQSATADYRAASKLSTAYVFPSSATELMVLRTALQAVPTDPTAHYLLGTLLFSRGMTDNALREWSEARRFGPELPVLSASVGLALLHVKNEPEQALSAFQEGVRTDPGNVANYLGADQALSLLHRPARERVAALEKFPHLETAPPGLIFELILNMAEAGDFDRATRYFRNRFFPREEGGTNVRQVWIEVRLQHMLAASRAGQCSDALATAQSLGSAVPGLAFTHDGLEPFVESARTNYLLATVYAACGKPELSKPRLQAAAGASAADQVHWARMAAQQLPEFNEAQWRERVRSAYQETVSRSTTSAYPSWWMYNAGLLAQELGMTEEAQARFHKALLLPDRMLAYHFTRLAESGRAQE